MAAASDLAVVICHGSYHTPAPYMPLLNVGDVDKLDFDLGPPAGGYPQGEGDLKAIFGVLNPLLDQGKRALLLAHSSRRWVATEAARPGLQAKHGLPGDIIGILYVGAFIIPAGKSVHSFFQPKDGSFVTPPFITFHKHDGAGLGTMVEPEKFLFNDLEQGEAQRWAPTLTGSPILTTKLANDAYANLPCAYLVLERDLTLPREYQESMAAAQGQKTGKFTMYHCPSGHSPHLSRAEEVVGINQELVGKISV
ncbi:alpha/beta-hydrolase [Camillea tinctor]|nr:alpha/beta-hydrolase [Camillea tinctor]